VHFKAIGRKRNDIERRMPNATFDKKLSVCAQKGRRDKPRDVCTQTAPCNVNTTCVTADMRAFFSNQ